MPESPTEAQKNNRSQYSVLLLRALIVLSVALLIFWVAQVPQVWQKDTIVYAQAERRRLMAQAIGASFPTYEQWRDNLLKMNKTLFYKDGICANVAVSTGGNPPVRCLFTNGHPDASDGGDLENQVLLAGLPLLLKPNAKNVCVVGFGSGVTAGYALRFPISKLVCAEIEPSVFETSRLFAHVNFSPETDPRTQLVPADGRNYLLCTDEKFDVIISEPSNPWQAGVCNLFTREYFQICKERLAPDGTFCFWSQVTEMPTKNLKEILAALTKVFPSVFIFDSGQGDICAVAMNERSHISMADIEQALANPYLARSLGQTHIGSPEDLISRIYMCPAGVTNAVKASDANSDDRNHLEFDIARSYENKIYRTQNVEWLSQNHGPIWDYIAWPRFDKQAKALEFAAIAERCLARNSILSNLWATESLKIAPTPAAYACLARRKIIDEQFEEASKICAQSLEAFPKEAYLADLQGTIYSLQLDCANAQKCFETASRLEPENPLIKYHLAQTYSKTYVGEKRLPHCIATTSNPQKVISLCKEAAANPNFVMAYPSVLVLLGSAYLDNGQAQEAINVLESAVQQNVRASLAWRLLKEANASLGYSDRKAICEEKERIFSQFEIEQIKKEVLELVKQKRIRDSVGLLQTILEIDPHDADSHKLLSELSGQSSLAKKILEDNDN